MKKYNEEKAIISLTSWSARINTVSKTIFSLLKMCPEFHIVLVLSEEEFPKKEKELPENLMLIVNSDLIELLWVFKNTKAFKKVLYTIDKYRDVPVISADDDCIYLCNYADELYRASKKNKGCIITYKKYTQIENFEFSHGPTTCFVCFGEYPKFYENMMLLLDDNIVNFYGDDVYYGMFYKKFGVDVINISDDAPYKFHDEICAMSKSKNGKSIVSQVCNLQKILRF